MRHAFALFVLAAKLTPRRLRFPLALFLANVFAFLYAISGRRRPPLRTLPEHWLAQLIGELDTRRVPFEPRIAMTGLELLADRGERGVLVATTHVNAGLSRCVLRVLHDRGMAYEFLSAAPEFPICGAAQGMRPIAPSGTFLLTIRKFLRAHGIVLAMLDSAEQVTRASVAIETKEGSFWISEPILRMAQRSGAEIVLMRGSLQHGTIAIELERADAADDPQQLARRLGAFALQRVA